MLNLVYQMSEFEYHNIEISTEDVTIKNTDNTDNFDLVFLSLRV